MIVRAEHQFLVIFMKIYRLERKLPKCSHAHAIYIYIYIYIYVCVCVWVCVYVCVCVCDNIVFCLDDWLLAITEMPGSTKIIPSNVKLEQVYKSFKNQQNVWYFCCIAITIMISITTVPQIHIQIHNTRTLAYFVVQLRTHLLTSDFGSSTRSEGHNSYYANHTIWPHKRAAHPVMFKISVGRDPKNPTTSSMVKIQLLISSWPVENLILDGPMVEAQLSACMVWCQPSTDSFSKSSNSQDHLFWARRHPHSSRISFLGVYYDNGDCHILCARA